MLNDFDNFIFDLDGTLVNSSQEVIKCFEKSFQNVNYKIDETRLTSDIIGPPLKDIVKIIAPELEDENIIDKVIKNFRQIYDYDENDISILYDGIYDLLLSLKQQNKKLFIATFKPKIPTYRLLKKFNFDMFDDIYTIDKYGDHITKIKMINDIILKYNLDKNKTVMIGDAISDIKAGKENNVKTIAALWGYETSKDELKKEADFAVKNVEELKCLK